MNGVTVSICKARLLLMIFVSVLIRDRGQQLYGEVGSLLGFSNREIMAMLMSMGIFV